MLEQMATRVPRVLLALSLQVLVACGGERGEEVAAAEAASQETDTLLAANPEPAAADLPAARATAQPTGPVTQLPPNELGEIMVLEYHRIGEKEGEWVRSAANFRKDLQTLYDKGYRPITMRQMAEGDIDIPAGSTPVVFTIDDSSLGQFYYREDGSIDPNTMMGMWAAFQKENPAWHYGAVWCILPGAEHPSNFFGEKKSKEVPREQREATIRRKMEYIVENRHEACNHTMWHARLDRYDDAFVQDQIGSGEDSIKAFLPADYDIVTFALPLGMWPKNRSLPARGTYRGGKTYENKVVLEVSGGPNVSPFDTKYEPHSVDRFIVAPGALERQLAAYERNPERRFVSDGNPRVVTVPQRLADRIDRRRLNGKEAKIIPDETPAATP
jgi:hypothetical protein